MAEKRELKRIEWSIVRRITTILNGSTGMKKTHIAMKAGLSYDKCALYLGWMEVLELIIRTNDEEGFQLISLSERGASLYRKCFMEEAPAVLSAT